MYNYLEIEYTDPDNQLERQKLFLSTLETMSNGWSVEKAIEERKNTNIDDNRYYYSGFIN